VTRTLLVRAGLSLLLVLAAASAMLAVVSLSPGDARAGGWLERDDLPAEQVRRLGLDRPLAERVGIWLGRIVRLDFDVSFRYREPVRTLVVTRAGNSAVLAGAALLVAVALALPLGVIAGSGRFPRAAAVIGTVSLVLLSLPPLLTALFLTVLAARTGWLPVGGLSAGADGGTALLLDRVRHLIVPALALGLPLAASLERVQASAVADSAGSRHVLAALARGVRLGPLLWHHLWRPTASPVTAIFGLAAGTLLSGALAVELVTAWPGLGRLMFEALATRDVPLAVGCAAAAAGFLAIWTTLADVAGWWLDPRTRPGADS
jgi:peptide/nickel transport system permease protein